MQKSKQHSLLHSKEKILITGASGFIGKHLSKHLREKGYMVLETRVRLEDERRILDLPKADIIIHLAAFVGVPLSWESPEEAIKINEIGTLNILKYCVKNNTNIIYAGSYCYGNPKYLPTDEEHLVSYDTSPYAISKIAGEGLCFAYSKKYGFDAISLRVFNPYGPGQSEKMVVSQMINELIKDNKITILDGRPKRDFIYIDDLVAAYESSIKGLKESPGIYNVGYGQNWSVREIADMLINLHGGAQIIDKNIQRSNEIIETCANITKIKNKLGWTPRIGIELGLERTYEWYANKTKERE